MHKNGQNKISMYTHQAERASFPENEPEVMMCAIKAIWVLLKKCKFVMIQSQVVGPTFDASIDRKFNVDNESVCTYLDS